MVKEKKRTQKKTISACAAKYSTKVRSLNDPTTDVTPNALSLSAFSEERVRAVTLKLLASGCAKSLASTEPPIYPGRKEVQN